MGRRSRTACAATRCLVPGPLTDLTEHDIGRTNDGGEVGEEVPATEELDRLQMCVGSCVEGNSSQPDRAPFEDFAQAVNTGPASPHSASLHAATGNSKSAGAEAEPLGLVEARLGHRHGIVDAER